MAELVLIFLIYLPIGLLMVSAGIAMLVLAEIIEPEDVRRWFKRKKGDSDEAD